MKQKSNRSWNIKLDSELKKKSELKLAKLDGEIENLTVFFLKDSRQGDQSVVSINQSAWTFTKDSS